MATSKTTSTKPKTPKTTRTKKTTKPTAVSRAAKTTKSVKTTRVTKSKSSATKAVRRTVWTTGNLLGLGLILYIGLAAAVVFLMKSVTFPVTLTHLTDNVLLSQSETSFITASKPLFDLDLRWVLVALLALSTALPLLYLTKLKTYYADRIANRRVIEARWLDLAVSSAIMIEVVALVSGYTDLVILKLLAGFMVTTCLLGWLAERQNEKAAAPVWSAYALSIFTGVLPWIAIGITKSATIFYGSVRSPWYVYAACVALLVGFSLLALNQLNQHRRRGKLADYAIVERNYVMLNVLTKVSFVAILLAGLIK